jgi:magnesium transporter
VLRHEVLIAFIKGIIVGSLVGVMAKVWMDNNWLGFLVGFAMLANILNATLIGVLVPLLLRRLRADPALASGIFVTTFSDVVGFLVFLGLGTLLVDRLS